MKDKVNTTNPTSVSSFFIFILQRHQRQLPKAINVPPKSTPGTGLELMPCGCVLRILPALVVHR